ncbi:MAG: hypothetical protein IJ714_00065 [Bacteroidales bacterium]|nr:hypothetical protein [Bacteroidales bacterium]
MKSITKSGAVAALIALAAVSCQSKLQEVAVPEEGVVTETLTLSIEDPTATKVDIANVSGTFSWTEGDQIAVWFQNGSTGSWSTGPVTANSRVTISGNGTRAKLAVYPAGAQTTFNLSATDNASYAQVTKIRYPGEISLVGKPDNYSPMPMIALNDPSRSGLKFFHVGGLVRFKLYGIPSGTKWIRVASDAAPLVGDFPVAIPSGNEVNAAALVYDKASWANAYGDTSWDALFGASHKQELLIKISESGLTAEGNGITISVPVPMGVYNNFIITALNASKQSLMTGNYAASTSEVVFDCERATGVRLANQALRRNHPMTLPNYVHGAFRVSDTKQVYFAKGNVMVTDTFDGTNHSLQWKFADNQWDYSTDIPPTTAGQTTTYSHFGWGTGNNPWLTSTSYGDYASFVDWGTHFDDLGNGSPTRTNGTWKTLSYAEWSYLYDGRPKASILRGFAYLYDSASLTTILGLLLLPDDWVTPSGCAFRPGATNTYGSTEHFLDGDWRLMEENGALFLPAAGERSAIDVVAGSFGSYWSSTEYESMVAYHLDFSDDGNVMIHNSGFYRSIGYSVRLSHE